MSTTEQRQFMALLEYHMKARVLCACGHHMDTHHTRGMTGCSVHTYGWYDFCRCTKPGVYRTIEGADDHIAIERHV